MFDFARKWLAGRLVRGARLLDPDEARLRALQDRLRGDGQEAGAELEQAFWRHIAARQPRSGLEVGTLQSMKGRPTHWRGRFPSIAPGDYVLSDVAAGEDVDVVADVHRLPEAWADRFDLFVANAVWEHLDRPWIAAREVARALAPNGVFYVATHQTFPLHGYPHDFFRFSKEALRLIFEDAGLHVAHAGYRYRSQIVPPTSLVPASQVMAWNEAFPSYIHTTVWGYKPPRE